MEGSVISGQLLKPRPAGSPPDMSPFFLRQYVKTHANNVFEDYPLLLMEIILRLPYQVSCYPQHIWDPGIFCHRTNSLEFTA